MSGIVFFFSEDLPVRRDILPQPPHTLEVYESGRKVRLLLEGSEVELDERHVFSFAQSIIEGMKRAGLDTSRLKI